MCLKIKIRTGLSKKQRRCSLKRLVLGQEKVNEKKCWSWNDNLRKIIFLSIYKIMGRGVQQELMQLPDNGLLMSETCLQEVWWQMHKFTKTFCYVGQWYPKWGAPDVPWGREKINHIVLASI
jgi:hypothetical protein